MTSRLPVQNREWASKLSRAGEYFEGEEKRCPPPPFHSFLPILPQPHSMPPAFPSRQDKDAYIESLRCEVRALVEELGTAQRRVRGMQADADAAELELSRRDLKIKVEGRVLTCCTLLFLCSFSALFLEEKGSSCLGWGIKEGLAD